MEADARKLLLETVLHLFHVEKILVGVLLLGLALLRSFKRFRVVLVIGPKIFLVDGSNPHCQRLESLRLKPIWTLYQMNTQLLVVLELALLFERLATRDGVKCRKQLVGVFDEVVAHRQSVQIEEQIAKS